jgi:hypothetical protein
MELYGRIGGSNANIEENLDLLNLIFPMYFPSTITYLVLERDAQPTLANTETGEASWVDPRVDN